MCECHIELKATWLDLTWLLLKLLFLFGVVYNYQSASSRLVPKYMYTLKYIKIFSVISCSRLAVIRCYFAFSMQFTIADRCTVGCVTCWHCTYYVCVLIHFKRTTTSTSYDVLINQPIFPQLFWVRTGSLKVNFLRIVEAGLVTGRMLPVAQ